MTALAPRFTWTSVINRLHTSDEEPKVRVPVDCIAHPLDEGMQKLDNPTDGSYIDYGIRVTELTWCVVRHYSDERFPGGMQDVVFVSNASTGALVDSSIKIFANEQIFQPVTVGNSLSGCHYT